MKNEKAIKGANRIKSIIDGELNYFYSNTDKLELLELVKKDINLMIKVIKKKNKTDHKKIEI